MPATTELKPNILHGGDWTVRYRLVATEGTTPSGNYTEVPYLEAAPTIPGVNLSGAYLPRNGRRAAAEYRSDSETHEVGWTSTVDAVNAFDFFAAPLRDEAASNWAGLNGTDISATGATTTISASTTDLSGWPIHVPVIVDFPVQGRVVFVATSASATDVSGYSLPALVDESSGSTVTAQAANYRVPGDEYLNHDLEFANVRGGTLRYAVHAKDARLSNVTLSGAVDGGVQIQVSGEAQDSEEGNSTYGTGTVDPFDATSRPLGVNKDWLGAMTASAAGGDLLPMNVSLTLGAAPSGLRAGGYDGKFVSWLDVGVPCQLQLDIAAQIGVSDLVSVYARNQTTDTLLTGWGDGTNYLLFYAAEIKWNQAGWQPNGDGEASGLSIQGQAIDKASTPAGNPYLCVSQVTI